MHVFYLPIHVFVLFPLSLVGWFSSTACGQALNERNWQQFAPAGKEVDAIYGDFALANAMVKGVIAQPVYGRNANMTVRRVGGCLIDFTVNSFASDQLSCFYPGARKFLFSSLRRDGDRVTVFSRPDRNRPECRVDYRLLEGLAAMEITTTWTNTTDRDWQLILEDEIRADGGKERMRKSPDGLHDRYFVNDYYWQQAYAIRAPGYRIRCNSNDRDSLLKYEPTDGDIEAIKPGDSFSFRRELAVDRHLVGALATLDALSGESDLQSCRFTMVNALGQPVAGADIELMQENRLRGIVQTDRDGQVDVKLPAGRFQVSATIAGFPLLSDQGKKRRINVAAGETQFRLKSPAYRPGRLRAKVSDGEGNRIPAKVEFIGHLATPTPDWGPDSAEHFVRNLAYTEDGEFEVVLPAGRYNVIASRGPEYDAVFTRIHIKAGSTEDWDARLRHSVQTNGWISSDFHSHSSPSGDNTGSQLGRVLNLAAEHVEFAPCTEHNRISTYEDHIAELGLTPYLATVSGIELTGRPLPLNHHNVFPMRRVPRTQDGGGPQPDQDPEKQIERATMWDDRSEKLVQQNHPDFGWLFYDRNGDGAPDRGFWRSPRLMDVVEIHPIDQILELSRYELRDDKPVANQRMLNWLQLLNQGFRIYGVVNTDAHYNYHGSGWLRNWIQCSTDDPAEIDPMEIVRASERGRLIMSNGPFLEARFSPSGSESSFVSGQEFAVADGKVSIDIRVQCPNWHDVDTVFVLINGRPSAKHTYKRKEHPHWFGQDTVKFEHTAVVELSEDSHLIVVAGHRVARLGDVMGPMGGSQHPAALTNPVFVDVDGNGFTPNKDTLGYPLPVKFDVAN